MSGKALERKPWFEATLSQIGKLPHHLFTLFKLIQKPIYLLNADA